jgi:hypothetical protein
VSLTGITSRFLGLDSADQDLWMFGVLESWLALVLAIVVFFEMYCYVEVRPAMRGYLATDFRRPAFLGYYSFFVVLDALAIGCSVGGIRFATGVSRGAAVLAALLVGAMFCDFCFTWASVPAFPR